MTREEADEFFEKMAENMESCGPGNPARLGKDLGMRFGNGSGEGLGNGQRKRDGNGVGVRNGVGRGNRNRINVNE